MASRRGFLRLSRVLPTSRVFTSGYVNMETILHFFNSALVWRKARALWKYNELVLTSHGARISLNIL